MLGWSINLFRIRGIRISLHFSFILLLAYVCNEGYREGGMPELWMSAAIFLAFFTCIVLHELGHSLTAMRFGVNVRRILLMPIGGVAEFDRIPRKPSQELLITAAGPAVNFVLAALFWAIARPMGGQGEESLVSDFLSTLVVWNIRVGLFNLIPAFPMDGGRILRAVLATRLSYLRATYWAAAVAKAVTIPGVIWAFFYVNGDNKYFLITIFIFIFLAGEAEYRAVKRRETEEAIWREALLRHVTSSTPPAEPPVLNG
jgi:Zn-dependent protease